MQMRIPSESDRRFGRIGRSAVAEGRIPSWIWSTSPVIACFHVYEDFFHYKSGVYTHTVGGFAGEHCIAIIGYEGGGWICKNSWGPGWGENGFCRIGFGQCGIDTWETYGIELSAHH